MGRWGRAVCQQMLNDYEASKGQNVNMKLSQVEGDFAVAIQMSPKNAYIYFNRGNLFAAEKNFTRAIDDYSRAIKLDSRLAEAYYNRGLARHYAGQAKEALHDFSRAGELGLYDAYALGKTLSGGKPSRK